MIELEDDFCLQNDPSPVYYVTTKWLGDVEGWDPTKTLSVSYAFKLIVK